MSDINPNRMIPLHICDAAVAACEKEIQELRAENARLKENTDKLCKHGDLEIARLKALGDEMAKKLKPCLALHNWVEATGGTDR